MHFEQRLLAREWNAEFPWDTQLLGLLPQFKTNSPGAYVQRSPAAIDVEHVARPVPRDFSRDQHTLTHLGWLSLTSPLR